MIEELLNRFEPDGDVLLRAISAHVTDEMLECISRADYGMDADKHFAALRELRDKSLYLKTRCGCRWKFWNSCAGMILCEHPTGQDR
jgi:hypothetical protein